MINVFDIPNLLHIYGYIGVFIVVFLESGILPPLPGDSLLFSAGLFASVSGFNIYFLISSICIATFFGSLLGYEIGFHFTKLRNYSFFKTMLSQNNLDKAHKFFEDHGKMAVIFARFLPFMRTFVPIVAGVAKMNYRSFLRYTAIGAIAWSTVMTLLGYFLGSIFPWIKDYLSIVVLLIVFVSILPFITEFVRRKFFSKRKLDVV